LSDNKRPPRATKQSSAYCPTLATRNGEIFRRDLALNCATSFRGDKSHPRAFILRASLPLATSGRRGSAYGFSFNTHLASRKRKTRSRSRKVISPLASLASNEVETRRRRRRVPAVSIGRLFNRKPGFSAVYLPVPCGRIWRTTKRRGRGKQAGGRV